MLAGCREGNDGGELGRLGNTKGEIGTGAGHKIGIDSREAAGVEGGVDLRSSR